MYGVAIAVAACLQAGTRADVAWLVDAENLTVPDWSEAVVFTPGGGRTGSVLGGALDGKLEDLAGRWSTGRLVELEVTEVDALLAGLSSGGSAHCLLVPADALPYETWKMAEERERFCIVSAQDGDEVTALSVYTSETISDAEAETEEIFRSGQAGSTLLEGRVISVFVAVPQMVVVGSSPVAEALVEMSRLLGWQGRLVTEPSAVVGHIAPLSTIDKVVVTGHDLELTGSALAAALESETGYIASLGSQRMQADRSDWLAYRGFTDLDRIYGPAGLDIGADTPAEIAVAIVAEAIAEGRVP